MNKRDDLWWYGNEVYPIMVKTPIGRMVEEWCNLAQARFKGVEKAWHKADRKVKNGI